MRYEVDMFHLEVLADGFVCMSHAVLARLQVKMGLDPRWCAIIGCWRWFWFEWVRGLVLFSYTYLWSGRLLGGRDRRYIMREEGKKDGSLKDEWREILDTRVATHIQTKCIHSCM